MKRGEIWWASLSDATGSEPGVRRPVVVVQENLFNESQIATVIVAILATNLRLAEAPGNVRISRRESKLTKDSVVNVSQILTMNKERLTQRVSNLSPTLYQSLERGLRLVLGL